MLKKIFKGFQNLGGVGGKYLKNFFFISYIKITFYINMYRIFDAIFEFFVLF